MTVSRKFFSETVTLAANTPTSVETLLQAAGWGFTPGTDNAIGTTSSQDSFKGSGLTIIPESQQLFVGHDQYVSNVAAPGPPRTYRGVPVAAQIAYSVTEYHESAIIDPAEVWLYSVNGQSIQLIWKAF